MNETTLPADPALDDDATVTMADKPREPTAYETELRKQARRYRDAVKAEKDAAAAAVAALKAEHETALASVTAAATDRLKRAELKAAAIQAGMVDPDGLKMLDLSAATLTDDGELKIPDKFFEDAKATKPFLFGAPSSSSSTHRAPPADPPKQKLATEMDDAEYRAVKTAVINRR